MSQIKMLRLLRLLMLLNSSRSYTIKEIDERLNISESTTYRYLDTFDSAGFIVNRNKGRYNLKADEKNVKSLNNLFHFSLEEAFVLNQTVSLLEKSSTIKEKLIQKLNTLYDFKQIADDFGDKKANLISVINSSIEKKQQLQIVAYRSSNSTTISNRLVEPFQFLDYYSAIWAFDLEDLQPKQFRLLRMKSVEILPGKWKYEQKHLIPFCDAFRIAAPNPIATVKATLSLKAFNLLIEEYPLTQPHIKKNGSSYILNIPVADYQGIGRFIMGLLEEIKVNEPEEFKNYLKQKIQKCYSTLIS